MTIAVAAVMVAAMASTHPARIVAALVAIASIGGVPISVLIGSVVLLVWSIRRMAASRGTGREKIDGAEAALEVLSLGTASGLTFLDAAQKAARAVPSARPDIEANLRRRLGGLPPDSGDPWIDQAFEIAGRSELTGASIGPRLRSQLAEMRRKRTEQRRARLARLPVKLLFPLVFLTLPGFVLLTVAPAVISGLSRLEL